MLRWTSLVQNRIEYNHIFSAKTNLHELNNLQYCLRKEKDLIIAKINKLGQNLVA